MTDKTPTKTQNLYAYIDNKKHKIGYAYKTKNGSICIKANKIIDKNQLGKLLIKGLYLQLWE